MAILGDGDIAGEIACIDKVRPPSPKAAVVALALVSEPPAHRALPLPQLSVPLPQFICSVSPLVRFVAGGARTVRPDSTRQYRSVPVSSLSMYYYRVLVRC